RPRRTALGRRSSRARARRIQGAPEDERPRRARAAPVRARRARPADARVAGLRQPMRVAAHGFFAQVAASVKDVETDPAYEPRARFRQVEDVIGELYDPLERLFALGREGEDRWRATLSTLARAEATPEMEELSGDVAAALGAWQEWQSGLKFLTDPRDHEFVYWRGVGPGEVALVASAPADRVRHRRD